MDLSNSKALCAKSDKRTFSMRKTFGNNILLDPKLFFWKQIVNKFIINLFFLSCPIPPNRGSSGSASPMLCRV